MANGEMWEKVNTFFQGLAGVATTVGGIVDTGADAAEDIARGKTAMDNQALLKAERKQAMAVTDQELFLRSLKTERGDNIQLYWAGAFVAVLAVILIARR